MDSPADRRAYLPISLPSCFTAAMALNSLDDSVVPKKTHKDIAVFFFLFFFFLSSPKERGRDINRLEEKQLFSALGGRVLLSSTRSLLEGSFVWGGILRPIACIGVVIKLSRGDLSSWCRWWPRLRPVLLRNRSAMRDTSKICLLSAVRRQRRHLRGCGGTTVVCVSDSRSEGCLFKIASGSKSSQSCCAYSMTFTFFL